jgi:hypothetical protein
MGHPFNNSIRESRVMFNVLKYMALFLFLVLYDIIPGREVGMQVSLWGSEASCVEPEGRQLESCLFCEKAWMRAHRALRHRPCACCCSVTEAAARCRGQA